MRLIRHLQTSRTVQTVLTLLTATIAIATLCAPAHGETLTLEQAIQRALAFAPTIASASAQSDLSTAMVREARAPLYPSNLWPAPNTCRRRATASR